MIVSRAHEWVGLLPAGAGVKCIRCELKCEVSKMGDVPRCHAHSESDTSGFFDESDDDAN